MASFLPRVWLQKKKKAVPHADRPFLPIPGSGYPAGLASGRSGEFISRTPNLTQGGQGLWGKCTALSLGPLSCSRRALNRVPFSEAAELTPPASGLALSTSQPGQPLRYRADPCTSCRSSLGAPLWKLRSLGAPLWKLPILREWAPPL